MSERGMAARESVRLNPLQVGAPAISQLSYIVSLLSTVLVASGAFLLSAFILLVGMVAWFGLPEIGRGAGFAIALALNSGEEYSQAIKLGKEVTATPAFSATPVLSTPTIEKTNTPKSPFTPAPVNTRLAKPARKPSPTQKTVRAFLGGEKRIIVSISEQHLYAYQGESLVYSYIVMTGRSGNTRTGTFNVLDKIPNAYSDLWGFWMPDWMGIYWGGTLENGIHALPLLADGETIWGDKLGTPFTYGCIVLATQDARHLFNWADLNTVVEIRK